MKQLAFTPRDQATQDFLVAFVQRWGCFPTYRAIAEGMGFTSLNLVRERLERLARHGVLERVNPPGMSQQWRLTGK